MGFWIRYIIFGVILAIAAYILLVNQGVIGIIAETLLSDEPSAEAIVDSTTKVDDVPNEQEAVPTTKTPKKKEKKSTNAAADGLSRFYASINPSSDGKGPRVRDNIVYLPEPKGELSKLLEARKMVTRPLRKNWRGDREARPFRVGETLYQKLSEYAEAQGLEVMWWLNRDFLVKDPFRVDKDILKTAFQIGKAVEGHFENGINIYFCYKHRALVLISDVDGYLETECTLLSNKKVSW